MIYGLWLPGSSARGTLWVPRTAHLAPVRLGAQSISFDQMHAAKMRPRSASEPRWNSIAGRPDELGPIGNSPGDNRLHHL